MLKMTKPAVGQMPTWSFSKWTQYQQCPLRLYLRFILKLPEPDESQKPALLHGRAVHTDAENYVRQLLARKHVKLPSSLLQLSNQFDRIARFTKKKLGTVDAELSIALDNNWNLAASYYDRGVWLRARIDLLITPKLITEKVTLVDYKTGSVNQQSEEQMELYLCILTALRPARPLACSELWYADSGLLKILERTTTEIDNLRTRWNKRIALLTARQQFQPKAGDHCRWCHYAKNRGGPCRY